MQSANPAERAAPQATNASSAPTHLVTRAMAVDALDFAPDLLALQERPPPRLPRAILMVTSSLVLGMLVWASFAKLDVVASAEGRLVPVSYTKVVQPAEAGVVQAVLVKDGDAVKAGQVLVQLDERLSQADTTALSSEVLMRKLTLKRIDAELADQPDVILKELASAPVQAVLQVQAQFRARRQAYLDATNQETEALNKAKAELQSAQQVLGKLQQTLPLIKQSAEAHQKLLKEGFIGEIAANEKMREAVEKEQDLKAQASTVDSLKSSIAQIDGRLSSVRSSYRSQLENEKLEALNGLNRSGQELEKSTLRKSQMEIKAPNDGVVKDLGLNVGQVVSAGMLLMNIVPQGEALQAEVLLKNEDAGFVQSGQKAMIKVAAFQFQKYGLLAANVALVSADSQDPKQTQAGQQPTQTYKALVRFAPQDIVRESAAGVGISPSTQIRYRTESGRLLALQPGMLVSAEIHQGQRTVMEYLLSPVRRVSQEAARER